MKSTPIRSASYDRTAQGTLAKHFPSSVGGASLSGRSAMLVATKALMPILVAFWMLLSTRSMIHGLLGPTLSSKKACSATSSSPTSSLPVSLALVVVYQPMTCSRALTRLCSAAIVSKKWLNSWNCGPCVTSS